MAEERKKTQAQKAADGKKASKKGPNTTEKKKESAPVSTPQNKIPLRLITSIICLALFIIFLMMFLNPEGALVVFFMNIIHGLIGSVSFYIAIPSLLYLFVIQAFSGKRPILLRSICLIVFTACHGQ